MVKEVKADRNNCILSGEIFSLLFYKECWLSLVIGFEPMTDFKTEAPNYLQINTILHSELTNICFNLYNENFQPRAIILYVLLNMNIEHIKPNQVQMLTIPKHNNYIYNKTMGLCLSKTQKKKQAGRF